MSHKTSSHHILPLRMYLGIGATLLVLTGITVWVAQYDLGPINLLVAMIIAATKGTLVAMFFMHLKYTSKLYATVFIGALAMLAVFIIFTMFDTMTRDQIYDFRAQPVEEKAIIYRDSAQSDSVGESTDSVLVDSSKVDSP